MSELKNPLHKEDRFVEENGHPHYAGDEDDEGSSSNGHNKNVLDTEFMSADMAMRKSSLLLMRKIRRADDDHMLRSDSFPVKKFAQEPTSNRDRRQTITAQVERASNILHQNFLGGLFLFLLILPLYCIFQLFLSFRDQLLIIFWRYTNINNTNLVIKFDYRKDMIMKSKGLGFRDKLDLRYILWRASKRYYILLFNVITLLISIFYRRKMFLTLDQNVDNRGINGKLVIFLQFLVYFFFAYFNVTNSKKRRGDIYDFISKFHNLKFIPIIDSDHTVFKTLQEIKDDLIQYHYVLLTTENHGWIILATKDLDELDIHDLIAENVFQNDQEITFIKIKSPYNTILLDKYKLLISIFREPFSMTILKREINSDITMSDMRLYNVFSILWLMLYYLTSLDMGGLFFLVFIGLLGIFAMLFVFRIRPYKNIQMRLIREYTVAQNEGDGDNDFVADHLPILQKQVSSNTSEGGAENDIEQPPPASAASVGKKLSGRGMKSSSSANSLSSQQGPPVSPRQGQTMSSNLSKHSQQHLYDQNTAVINHHNYHREFIDIKYIEKKGKQLELNPFHHLQQFSFFTVFNGTILQNKISDVLLRCCHTLTYRSWEKGLEFMDFINFLDRLSNVNQIGLMLVNEQYVLYHNIERENLQQVIVYEEKTRKLRLEMIQKIDFTNLMIPNQYEFESFRGKFVL